MLPSCGGSARNAHTREAPPGPHRGPPLARMPLAPGSKPNWAQTALAGGLTGLLHPGAQEPRQGWGGQAGGGGRSLNGPIYPKAFQR